MAEPSEMAFAADERLLGRSLSRWRIGVPSVSSLGPWGSVGGQPGGEDLIHDSGCAYALVRGGGPAETALAASYPQVERSGDWVLFRVRA